MIVTINVDSDVPVYRQIVDALRPMFIEDKLVPGDLLPPVRQLAADPGVHFKTVAEAYRLLAEEGWLDLRREGCCGFGAEGTARRYGDGDQVLATFA
jgi:DNA-binding transcriptional regulator YhcF (GntR family)